MASSWNAGHHCIDADMNILAFVAAVIREKLAPEAKALGPSLRR